MSDELKSPFVFVPEGAPVPDAVRGPNWVRIPATFVPRGGGRVTAGGQPWPRDRSSAESPKDRFGRPVCPLSDLDPGVLAPGEAAPDRGDPVAAFLATDAVFRDPAGAVGVTHVAAAGRSAGAAAPSATGPVAAAVPDWSGKPVPRQPGKQPVYDIHLGGLFDETYGQSVLGAAQTEASKGQDNVVYFPQDTDPAALAL